MESSAAIAIIETDLRHLVEAILSETDGPEWHDKAMTPEVLAKLKERQEEEAKRRAPAKVPSALMHYTHLYELRKIIEKRWDLFKVALGEKREFAVLMDKVEDFRNAPAHSRELLPHERSLLEGIAGEVRTKVTVYLSQRSPDAKYYPVIESARDSFGNTTDKLNPRYPGGAVVTTGLRLQVGQEVTFECRGWDPQGRDLTWWYGVTFARTGRSTKGTAVSFTYIPSTEDVGLGRGLEIELMSGGPYHRFGTYDHRVTFLYDVDPPE